MRGIKKPHEIYFWMNKADLCTGHFNQIGKLL